MRRVVLGVAGLCLAAWAGAQTPPAPAASAPDAATAERMERARREAANPLRMIIEASQVKARAKVAEPGATAAAASAAPAARTAERRAVASPQPSAIVERVEPLPVTAVSTASPPPPRAPEATAGAAPAAVPTAVATAPVAAPVAAQPTAATPPASAAAQTPAPAPKPAPVAVAEAPLKLVNFIEPELPQRVRSRLKANSEVTVAFTVNKDGSVSDVEVRDGANPVLAPIVLAAVRQWRYAPLPASREHLVQLVFKLND